MNPISLAAIAQYGIALFSIGAIIYIVTIFVKFIREHLAEATKSNEGLKNSINEMLLYFKLKNGSK